MSVRRAVLGELTKFASARSTVWSTVAMVAMVPVLAVVVATTGSLQEDDTVLGASLTGAVPAQMLAGVIGALTLTSEYRTGSIRTTLVAVPHRRRLLVAKAIVVAVITFAGSLVSVAGAYLIGRSMLAGDRYATGDAMPAVFGVAASITLVAVLGLALSAVIRHAAGTIAAVIAVLLLPSLFGPILGDYQRWLGGASPTGVLEKLTQTSDATHDTVGSLGAWPSLAAAALIIAGSSGAAALVFRRRDA